MGDCFATYAETGGLLILLDGLDEISNKDFPVVHKAIEGLSRKLARMSDKNVIILTMRSQFHSQVRELFRDTFGVSLFLKPFSLSDIYSFLSRWPFRQTKEVAVTRIYTTLSDRPTLREMCSNPLVLSMYVAKDQVSGHEIPPSSRTEFYSEVVEELIIRRRQRQLGPGIPADRLKDQRQRILGRVALEHLLEIDQPANSLRLRDALRAIQHVMECKESDAESIFQDLAKETGLITEEKQGQSFRFIHLTFCEFMAAFEAVHGSEDGVHELIGKHVGLQSQASPQLRTRLLECVPFAVGLLPRHKRATTISKLTEIGDRRLLARCFLETSLYHGSAWPLFLHEQQRVFLEAPESEWNSEWLQDLGLFHTVVSSANEHLAPGRTFDLSPLYQQLAAKGRSRLPLLLRAYARHDALNAYRLAKLCQIDPLTSLPELTIESCDQKAFFDAVRKEADLELDRQPRWAFLFLIGAMRSQAFATSLESMPADAVFAQAEMPAEFNWIKAACAQKSLYPKCFAVAAKLPGGTVQGPLFRAIIAAGRFPATYFRSKGLWPVRELLLFASLCLLIVSQGMVLAIGSPIDLLILASLVLGVVMLAFLVSIQRKHYRRVRRMFLNLDPDVPTPVAWETLLAETF